MRKKVLLLAIISSLLILSFVVDAKQRLVGTSALFHQPNIAPFSNKQVESTGISGFEQRQILFSKFPQLTDSRVRRYDVAKVSLIRTLLEQTADKKLYTSPDFKTLNCNGRIIFDKDRAMINPLSELACLQNVQVPYLRSYWLGTQPFLSSQSTGSVVKKITGRVASGLSSSVPSDCNERLKDIAFDTIKNVIDSERALVKAELDVTNCGQLVTARAQFLRGDDHLSALRFGSAINSYEDTWRKIVSCACRNLG